MAACAPTLVSRPTRRSCWPSGPDSPAISRRPAPRPSASTKRRRKWPAAWSSPWIRSTRSCAMPDVVVEIAGKKYRIGCEEGQEQHLLDLAADFNVRVEGFKGDFGEIGDTR